MNGPLSRLCDAVFSSLKDDFADIEIYHKNSRSSRTYFDDQHDGETSKSLEEGIAFRLWNEKREESFFHFSSASERIPEIIKKLSKKAGKNSGNGGRFSHSLPPSRETAKELKIFCPETADIGEEKRAQFVRELQSALQKEEKEGIKLQRGELIISYSKHFLCNSRGFKGGFKRTAASLALSAMIGQKSANDVDFSFASCSFADLDVSSISREVLGLSLKRGAGLTISDGVFQEGYYPVLFAPQAGSELLKCFVPYLKRRQDLLLSEHLTIIDDPLLEKGINSAPFDGGGFPTERRMIIEKGHFMNALKTLVRVSYTDRPQAGPSNIFIQPRHDVVENMLEKLDQGFYVTFVRPSSGRSTDGTFRAQGSGYAVRHGRISMACPNLFISGDIFDIFRTICGTGSDLRFHFRGGSFGAPSILVGRMKVSPDFS